MHSGTYDKNTFYFADFLNKKHICATPNFLSIKEKWPLFHTARKLEILRYFRKCIDRQENRKRTIQWDLQAENGNKIN